MAKNYRVKISSKDLISVGILLLVVIGIAAAIIFFNSSETKQLSAFDFSIGSLDSETGEPVKNKATLYTKTMFECQGLVIEPAENTEIDAEFEVFYYREDKSFIGKTSSISNAYEKKNNYDNAKYARIVLIPVLEEDKKEIKFWETLNYASLITVTVLKDQSFDAPLVSAFETVRDDYKRAVEGTTYHASRLNDGPFALAGANITAFENHTIKKISVPIAGVVDYTKDSMFSVYVVEGDGTKPFDMIQEVELTIPAYKFKSNISSTDPEDNEIANGADVTWYEFDCNITLEEGQTLAFSDKLDTVYFAYRKTFTQDNNKYPMYNLVLNGVNRTPIYSIEIYFDVEYLE